jgi:hypothetical protein
MPLIHDWEFKEDELVRKIDSVTETHSREPTKVTNDT